MERALKKIVQNIVSKFGYKLTKEERQTAGKISDEFEYAKLCEEYSKKLQKIRVNKAHYGCGSNLLGDGWLNLDQEGTIEQFIEKKPSDYGKVYLAADLISKHPFPSDFFRFSFAEDFLEHLSQAESIIFLSEAFRTLRPGGVLRLSFPGLRGVLKRHYRSGDYEGAVVGQQEAFNLWGHKHFYCEESLSLVASHIGFTNVNYVKYGKSNYEELYNLDSRLFQTDLNIFAELRK